MSEIRAFLAIDLEDNLKNQIEDIEDDFKGLNANIKYVEPANLHFTLKFFGDIDVDGLDLISSKIETVVKEFEPFEIAIEGCGAFPNKNHIKVIWLGCSDNGLIKELHDKLDAEFSSIGIEKDKKFSTHMTIGRMKSAKNKEDVKDLIKKYENQSIGNMKVKSISLKQSTLKPSGPIYNDLKVYDL